MFAYCLFCNTIRRDELAAGIHRMLDVEVIAPKIIQRKWIKGKATEEIHDYLPGYLFLYAAEPIADLSPLFRFKEVFRVLGEKDQNLCLSGPDFAFAKMLRLCGGTIGVLKTYREGDRVKLAESAMRGVDGEIIRLDRRGRALIRFGFDGKTIQSWVAIEMIEDSSKLVPKTETDDRTD